MNQSSTLPEVCTVYTHIVLPYVYKLKCLNVYSRN